MRVYLSVEHEDTEVSITIETQETDKVEARNAAGDVIAMSPDPRHVMDVMLANGHAAVLTALFGER